MHENLAVGVAVLAVAVLAGCAAAPTSDETTYGNSTSVPTVLEGNSEALLAAGSFHYEISTTLRPRGSPAGGLTRTVSARVDLATGELLVHQQVGDRLSVAGYADGEGNAFRRLAAGNRSQVQRVNATAVNATRYVRPPLRGLFDGLTYTHRGAVRRNGTLLHNYTATAAGLGLAVPRQVGPLRTAGVTHVESNLLVTPRGVLRSFAVEMTGTGVRNTTYVYRVRLSYDDVGSTTVPRPAWVPSGGAPSAG
ncbi:MAG: hypothetical protein ABEJ30_07455 [Halorientalis sp.]